MGTEEFQSIVLQELRALREGQQEMKKEQQEMKKDLKALIEQTANLTEFKEDINYKLDTVINEIHTLEVIV